MKHFLLVTILLITCTSVFSQSANEQAVKKAVETFLLVMKKNDAGTAANLLADNYKMDGHSGVGKCITNKAERLTSIQTGQIKYGPIDFDNKANHLYIMNDTTAAVLAQQITVTYKTCENHSQEYTDRTCVFQFMKIEGRWLLSLECVGRNCVR